MATTRVEEVPKPDPAGASTKVDNLNPHIGHAVLLLNVVVYSFQQIQFTIDRQLGTPVIFLGFMPV